MWRRLLVLALLLAARSAAATPIGVVLLGDSITAGRVSQPTGPPWAALLEDALGPDFSVANVACGGTSSLDWTLTRGNGLCGAMGFVGPTIYQARALPALPAQIVTVMLGTNDATGFFEPSRVPVATYRSAIDELVGDLLDDGADTVVLMTPPAYTADPIALALLTGYRGEILDVCASTPGVVCGPDVFTLLGPSDFAPGNVHPNAQGHAEIAVAVEASIRELAAVPEPGTGVLVAGGLAPLAAARRRRRARPPRER